MKCHHCGNLSLIPVTYGQPDELAWQAMLLGKMHLGGSCLGDDHWHCPNCFEEVLVDDRRQFEAARSAAFDEAAREDLPDDAMELMQGNRSVQRTVFLFASMGARAVKIVDDGNEIRTWAIIVGDWEEFESPIAKYFPQMMKAVRCGRIPLEVYVRGEVRAVHVAELEPPDVGIVIRVAAE
jgi:hypothetical protein